PMRGLSSYWCSEIASRILIKMSMTQMCRSLEKQGNLRDWEKTENFLLENSYH
ncbi:hypothetical protein U1Q18_047439, partial [Sarracenia purpurea var. burkii]